MNINVRRIVLALCICTGVLSCKEVPPLIDFSEPILLARDTTYVTTDIPQNPLKSVLIEDVSGVKCNNCPRAAIIAHDVQKKYAEGRVIVMTLHSNDFGAFTSPYADSKDTFNTAEATQIIQDLYIGNVAGLPTGCIDRKVFDGETQSLLAYAKWETKVDEQLLETPKVLVDVEIIRKPGRTIIANVKATFLEDDATPVYMSVFITESHILSKQKMPDNTYDKNFEHNFILRKGVTTFSGLRLAESVEVGRVFEKGFEIDIPEKYKIENCSIVVLINKIGATSNEVLQSAEGQID